MAARLSAIRLTMADGLAISSERKDSPFLPAFGRLKNWLEIVPLRIAETTLIVPYSLKNHISTPI